MLFDSYIFFNTLPEPFMNRLKRYSTDIKMLPEIAPNFLMLLHRRHRVHVVNDNADAESALSTTVHIVNDNADTVSPYSPPPPGIVLPINLLLTGGREHVFPVGLSVQYTLS